MSTRTHIGWWPAHWGAAGFVLFPIWLAVKLLLVPALYLNRLIVTLLPGRRWRDWIDDHVLLGGAVQWWDVAVLKREGIGAVINFCAEFCDPVEKLRAEGMEHLDLPTLDRTPPHPDDLRKAVDFMRHNAARGVKTYVHCASGVGRSATAAACYLVAGGMSYEEAMARLKSRRPACSPRRRQRDAIREFRESPQTRDRN